MMNAEALVVTELKDGIFTVRLNRPEKRNAVNAEMMVRLARAWQEFRETRGARVAIITGSGSQQFCAGADLKSLEPLIAGHRAPADEWDRAVMADPQMIHKSVLYGVELDKPVICALNGDAFGGGAEMMLATHLRVAAEGIRIGLPEPKWATLPAGGGMVCLPRQIPYAHAMEMLLTGDPIPVERALALGLVNRIVPREQVMNEALKLARSIADNGPLAIQTILAISRRTLSMSIPEAHHVEAELIKPVFASKDSREGLAAFVEKRKPHYRGE
jgi:enoyl-CoA hydratase